MVIDYAKYRQQLETMYEDLVSVLRYGDIELPESGETVPGEYPVHTNVPCRISQKALGANGQTESVNNIVYETKMFISPDVEIKQGDKCIVARGNSTREYTAGEPFLYPTHQEISLQREDKA
ncbi:ABC transporter ATP-binding protein [Paenibacillus xylanexedens]|uniref:ABC transporter ATP-binding protein n=1 Tax=Paenibacillus xylanexedens TaxID=528191 RepID=UPI0016439D91|nr:ABC transporter ATP-binding protein [Paenibacillus xylanexedens]